MDKQLTPLEKAVLYKHKACEKMSYLSTSLLGFLTGALMVLLPVVLVLIILFFPVLYHSLAAVFAYKNIADELIIVERFFAGKWQKWLLVVLYATLISSIMGACITSLRKLGYSRNKWGKVAKKIYSQNIIIWVVVSIFLFCLMLKTQFNIWGLIFMAIVFGWLFRHPINAYFLYIEDFIFEKYIIKEWI